MSTRMERGEHLAAAKAAAKAALADEDRRQRAAMFATQRGRASVFRYDLASPYDPRVILITDHDGKRSDVPRLGYVVVPR